MNKKAVLVIIGVLVLIMGVIGGLRISHGKGLSPDETVVDSIISWETIVSKVSKLADHDVREIIVVRGEKEGYYVIPDDMPILWISSRSVGEHGTDIPGGFHSFSVWIGFYESEAAVEEKVKLIPLAGYKIQQEDQITIGFCEEQGSWGGRESNMLGAFVTKGRLWVSFTVITYIEDSEGDPFAEREDLEELIEIVKENLLGMNI